jgi:hypothetical protein
MNQQLENKFIAFGSKIFTENNQVNLNMFKVFMACGSSGYCKSMNPFS